MPKTKFGLIWINGMPRSGTSWVAQIVDSSREVNFKMAPLFSYRFKNVMNQNSSDEEWFEFFNNVYKSDDPFLNQIERKSKGDFISFSKTETPPFLVVKDVRNHHLMERLLSLDEAIKIVHIVRNPCAMISSWMNSKKEYIVTNQTKPDEWKTGQSRKKDKTEFWGFNDWITVTKMYQGLQQKYPSQVYIVNYEKMVKEPLSETIQLFDFCGLHVEKQTEEFLSLSHSVHHSSDYSIFKDPNKVLNDWKDQLSHEIMQEIISITSHEGLSLYLNNG